MDQLTLKHFDEAIAAVESPTKDPQLNELCRSLALVIATLRTGYVGVLNELQTMYESAAEHNVDISREAIIRLVEQLRS